MLVEIGNTLEKRLREALAEATIGAKEGNDLLAHLGLFKLAAHLATRAEEMAEKAKWITTRPDSAETSVAVLDTRARAEEIRAAWEIAASYIGQMGADTK